MIPRLRSRLRCRVRPSIINTEFSINAGFTTQFNPKDEVTLEFGIILSLMLIVSQQIGLKLDD